MVDAMPLPFATVSGWVLVWFRCLALTAWLPFSRQTRLPLGAAFAFSVPLAFVLAPLAGPGPVDFARFVRAAAGEIICGFGSGLIAIAVLRLGLAAAEQIDMAIGFRLGASASGEQVQIQGLGGFYSLLAVAAMIGAGVPHAALGVVARAVAETGAGVSPDAVSWQALNVWLGRFWQTTLLFCAPALVLVIGAQLVVGLANRMQPSLGLFFVLLPAMILIGLRFVFERIDLIFDLFTDQYRLAIEALALFWGVHP
ncbi:MAG: type III secretion protein [Candidatus Dadabacteria bacterium]|nr:MAG: type III secretion protein [Candidatus Dadabacteria bacterium]